jgi:hypothetical protein
MPQFTDLNELMLSFQPIRSRFQMAPYTVRALPP